MGESLENVARGIDCETDPPAARRRAPASRRSTSRRWCRSGCIRSPSPAATPSCSSRARRCPLTAIRIAELLRAGRAAQRRAQPRARRPRVRRRAPHASQDQGDLVRRLDARSPSTSTRPAPHHGKRVQAAGGAKNYVLVMPDADVPKLVRRHPRGRLRLRGRAVHGRLHGASRSARRPTSSCPQLVDAASRIKVGPTDRDPEARHGARDHAASTATASASSSSPGAPRKERTSLADGRTTQVPWPRAASSSAPPSLDRCPARHDHRRSEEVFGPVLNVMRMDDLDAAIELANTLALRQRRRDLHRAAARRRANSSTA